MVELAVSGVAHDQRDKTDKLLSGPGADPNAEEVGVIESLEDRAAAVEAVIAALETQRSALLRDAASVARGPARAAALRRFVARKRTLDAKIAAQEQQRDSLASAADQLRNFYASRDTASVVYSALRTVQDVLPAQSRDAILAGVERAGESLADGLGFARELSSATARAAGTLEGRDAYGQLMGGAATTEPEAVTEMDLMRELGLENDGTETDAAAAAAVTEHAARDLLPPSPSLAYTGSSSGGGGSSGMRARAAPMVQTSGTAGGFAPRRGALGQDAALLEAAGLIEHEGGFA